MKSLITGVSRGIGCAIATEMLARGHEVWGLSRTVPPERLTASDRFHHLHCNLSADDSRERTAQEMESSGFRPDVVVLNAAIEYEEDPEVMAWDKMREVWRTNVEGALFWVAHWLDRVSRPPIQFIAISSLTAFWPDVDCPAYCSSKAALSMAFRALRLRYAGHPFSFKCLYLGPVQTTINPRFATLAHPGKGVVPPEAVAAYLVKTVLSKRRFAFYYPWSARWAFRLGAWMPDRMFERLTRSLRR